MNLFSVLVKILAWAIIFNSCTNPFSTRENKVEKPENSGSVIFEEPTTPDNVKINLRRAIENRNLTEYIETLSDPVENPGKSFRFLGETNFIDQLRGWSYQDESIYFKNLIFPDQKQAPALNFAYVDSVTFTNINFSTDSVESNFFTYQLTVKRTQDSTEVYRGQAQLKMFKNQTSELWYIYYWSDQAVGNNIFQTWTYLKIINR